VKEIIIFSPGNIVSGGVNSLHNLCASLNRNGFNASMHYIDREDAIIQSILIQSYQVKEYSGNIDTKENIIIVPETMTDLLANYKKALKVVYWLGLKYYFKNPDWKFPFNYKLFRKLIACRSYAGHHNGIIEITKRKLNEYAKGVVNIWNNGYVHVSNSYFVADYCKNRGANHTFVIQNPVRDEIYNLGLSQNKRKNIILFGQRTPKLILFLSKLLFTNFKIIKVKKMPYDKVIQLMSESKVFAELGINHGRDRMPREAAILGCIVFINRRGSSSNKKDYLMNDNYILKNSPFLYFKNLRKIKKVALNHNKYISDFKEFNKQLQEEKQNFDRNVKKAFNLIIKLQNEGSILIK
jgi:hypothetical protein